MRIAVSQFATAFNFKENLAICIGMINETAVCNPSLIVLPEFCNTLFCPVQPSYIDHNQAWDEALPVNGRFMQGIAEQSKKHHCYIVLNVTLRRDRVREHEDGSIKSNISVTTCIFSPQGELIHQVDKSTLNEHEKLFFISNSTDTNLVTTSFGKIGLLAGCENVTFTASRVLALEGAQLLCNSSSSFTLEQSTFHGPTRAFENNVFLATANKVGPLTTQVLTPQAMVQQTFPHDVLVGVGQSHIVSPEGNVLAKITNNEQGFVFADLDLAEVGRTAKNIRPDGTELTKQRRPELYREPVLNFIKAAQLAQDVEINTKVPETANVAIFATYKTNEQAIDDVCHYIENNLSDIIQLPELFFIADKSITHDKEQVADIERLGNQLIKQVSAQLRPFQYVCTSLIIEGVHQAVLISQHGLYAMQQQLHFCQRYRWTTLGDELSIIELPLEQGVINVAMLTADDANIPEIVSIAASHNVHLLLVPFDIQAPCEVEYALLSRVTENRVCLVASSREKSFSQYVPINNGNDNVYSKNKQKSQKSTGLIVDLTTDLDLSLPSNVDKFKGYVNQPIVKYQFGKITKAVIHPLATCTTLG